MSQSVAAIRRDVTLTEQDLIDAHLLHALRLQATPWFFYFPVLTALILLGLSLSEGDWAPAKLAFSTGIAILFGAMVAVGLRLLPKFLIPRRAPRMYREQPELSRASTVVLTPEIYSATQTNSHMEMPWSDFLRWSENDRIVLLYRGRYLFTPLPKRAFGPGESALITSWLERAGVPKF
jgi:hypothetical protein